VSSDPDKSHLNPSHPMQCRKALGQGTSQGTCRARQSDTFIERKRVPLKGNGTTWRTRVSDENVVGIFENMLRKYRRRDIQLVNLLRMVLDEMAEATKETDREKERQSEPAE
jgi:hypothetical protein